MNAKVSLVRGMVWSARALMMSRVPIQIKKWAWLRFCVPFLSWRDEEFVVSSCFGSYFNVRPSDFVEQRICFFGVWEPQITSLFRQVLRPGDVFIDVGANVGYYSILAARLVGPSGRVYAVEPSKETRRRLEKNLILNEVDNVVVLPFAASNSSGRAKLVRTPGNSGAARLSEHEDESNEDEVVDLRVLDEEIPLAERRRVKFIKIDVEGKELPALQGLTNIIDESANATLICEVHSGFYPNDGERSADDVFSFAQSKGFEYRVVAQKTNTTRNADDYFHPTDKVSLIEVVRPFNSSGDIVFSRNLKQDFNSDER